MDKHYLRQDLISLSALLRKHAGLLGVVIVSYFSSYVLNLLLSNMLSPAAYGDIAVVLQLLSFCMPFALLGTELSIVRYLPMYLENRTYGYALGFLWWCMEVFLMFTACILFLSSIVIFLSVIYVHREGMSDQWHIVVYSLWLIPLYALTVLLSKVLQVFKKIYWSSALSGWGGVALNSIAIGFLYAFWQAYEGAAIEKVLLHFLVVGLLALAMLCVLCLEVFLCWKALPAKLFHKKAAYKRREWSSTSVKMLGSTLVFAALISADIFLVEIFTPDQVDVGHFASLTVIGGVLGVFGQAVDILVNPRIFPCVERKEFTHLQSLLHVTNIGKSIPAIMLTVVIAVFGKSLLAHFGESFIEAYPALLIITSGFLIGILCSSAGALLVYSHHQMLNFYISLGQLLFIIIGDSIFIPLYRLNGATAVLAVSIALSSLLRVLFVRKYLGLRTLFFV